jgi:hypothetical protein
MTLLVLQRVESVHGAKSQLALRLNLQGMWERVSRLELAFQSERSPPLLVLGQVAEDELLAILSSLRLLVMLARACLLERAFLWEKSSL